jgi:hypothetical protein
MPLYGSWTVPFTWSQGAGEIDVRVMSAGRWRRRREASLPGWRTLRFGWLAIAFRVNL